jgi:hypothetical protein
MVRALGSWLVRTWRENWLFLLIIGAILIGFLALRTPASAVGSVSELDALLHDGQPTFVEFYSNT